MNIEMAVFFRDGKAYDVFGPGRHTLTTLNLPLLTGLLTRLAGFGGNKPFKATVLFISTKVFAGKWGTRAQTTELAPLQVYGQFWFKVGDASLFVNEVIGGQKAYTTEGVNNFLRGFLNEKIIDELSHYDLITVFTRIDETSVIVKNTLIDYFKRVGIELTDLRFEGIDTTPEYRERLFWLKTGQTAPGDVLRMETVKSAAASLGQGGGAGALGAGMVLIPQIMNQQGNTSSTSSGTGHLPQMQRKSARYKQILPQLRNQPHTANSRKPYTVPNAANPSQPTANSVLNADTKSPRRHQAMSESNRNLLTIGVFILIIVVAIVLYVADSSIGR